MDMLDTYVHFPVLVVWLFWFRLQGTEVQGWGKVVAVVCVCVCICSRQLRRKDDCGDTGFVAVQPKGQTVGKDDLRKQTIRRQGT